MRVPSTTADARALRDVYRGLYVAFGPQHWWPGDTPLEIAVGAILTQNTAWANVEKAMAVLKSRRLLGLKRLARLSIAVFCDNTVVEILPQLPMTL